ncbi:MAG: metal-dependent hydrolase [Nanoarchaeota archaeon]
MALAVTHVLIPLVLLDLFRHYLFGKNKFPRYLVVIGGIAGLAPDLDIPLGWLVSLLTGVPANYHGLFTHSIFFVLLFLAIGLIRHYQHDRTTAKIFYVIAFGWLVHLPLDCLYGGAKSFLWPWLSGTFSWCPTFITDDLYAMGIDAALLVLWLVHEEVQKKIKDYF